MKHDDDVCYCYHVPLRKLLNFARRERLVRASQMSNCLGAGTGCGWCIPVLTRIFEQAQATAPEGSGPAEMGENAQSAGVCGLPASAEDYAAGRTRYLKSDTKHRF